MHKASEPTSRLPIYSEDPLNLQTTLPDFPGLFSDAISEVYCTNKGYKTGVVLSWCLVILGCILFGKKLAYLDHFLPKLVYFWNNMVFIYIYGYDINYSSLAH